MAEKERFRGAFGEWCAEGYYAGRKEWPDIEVKCCRHGTTRCTDPTCKTFEEEKKR